MRRVYHGGQNARDWRRKVAALAKRQSENVRTFKFGLDCQSGDFDFHAASRAYDVTEGIAQGSLIGLVCAVHLSGFRLFSKTTETRQFRNRSRYPASAFSKALKEHAGNENPRLTIQSIEDVFATPPRARGGKAPAWSADDLARRLFQVWNKRSPRESDHDQPDFEIADGIARAVARKFDGWKALAEDVEGALACADRHLATLGDSFPNLSGLMTVTEVRPENCTFAYDAESPFVDMADNKQIWLHQTVAVCAGRLKRDTPGINPSSPEFARDLKDAVVTRQNNGLSWLFGNGLRYLRTSNVGCIAKDLSVPDSDIQRVEQLKKFAATIPDNPFFDTDSYAEFRGSTGGKLSSWASNYWKRVRELAASHSKPPDISIPEALLNAENASLFSGQHTDAAGLEALSERIPKRIENAGRALAVLSGDGVPESKDIDLVEEVAGDVAELFGQIAMLNNRIDQEINQTEDKDRAAALEALRQSLPENLREPPKLNRISGGTADATVEVARLEAELNAATRARREHFQRFDAWMTGNGGELDPLRVMADRERKALVNRGMEPTRADEQALRRLLHRIAAMSRRLSQATAAQIRDAMTPLFQEKREANLFFHNRRGAIYRHPFSTSRHQEYAIDIDRARETDWLAWLDNCLAGIRERLGDGEDEALIRDLLSIEGFVFTQRLGGLPNRVPGELARLHCDGDLVGIPALLSAQLDAAEVPRDVAVRAFNLFNSAVNGLSFRAFRDSFIVRVKFQRLGREELFYTPKDCIWRPPEEYLSAKGEIARGLALPAVELDDETGAVLPQETAKRLSEAKFPEGSRALLRQSPHDWFVELDLRHGEPSDRTGLPVKKNASGLKRWRSLKRPAFRLAGPPSFKTWLDRALVSREVKLGDYTLLLDREFKQSFRVEGETVRLTAEPVKTKAELAVPVIDLQPHPDEACDLLFDNVVAIDLGEKRIGYAVFSLVDLLDDGVLDPVSGDNGKPVTGTVAVPAIRRLMAAVRRHRGSRQPNQKVGQTYSKALMQFRENVVGDVCNRIDTLCERFRAFPVLESSVGNFEAGGRQLEMIYGSVIRRYIYSETEAHKATRAHYWFTADRWDHPYIHTCEWKAATKTYTGKPKPLTMFPGVTVHPAGTSQTCHRCRRNALKDLRDMPDKIHVEEDGKITLPNGVMRLYERADYQKIELRKFRRRKERPPLNVPVPMGIHGRSHLERIAKRNMRQAPRSEMSPDTTQARFVCPYTDCGYEGHADVNAAVNIGRRFLDRIDIKASRNARG